MKNEVLEHQYELGQVNYKVLRKRFDDLGLDISTRYNHTYEVDDYLGTLVTMSLNNMCVNAATHKRKRNEANYFRKNERINIPSENTVLKCLKSADLEKVKQWGDENVKAMLKNAKKHNMVKKGGTIAIDMTGWEYYGKALKPEMLKTKPKNGTARFHSFMTAQMVNQAGNIPLFAHRVTSKDKMVTVMRKIIEKLIREDARPELGLFDRGFYNVACIDELLRLRLSFIMPAIKNKRIQKYILEVHNKKRKTASVIEMRDKNKKAVKFTLLIVKKNNAKGTDKTVDQYVAFATNMKITSKSKLIKTIPETYRKRWIIETGYRVIKNTTPKTTSNALQLRLLLIFFGMLLYGLWVMARYENYGGLVDEKLFTMDAFVDSIAGSIRRLLRWELEHGGSLPL